jgi:hypothetical protein
LTNIPIGAYLVRPMPSSLRNRLNELAASFSAGVLDAIRGASLEELLSESSSGSKGRAQSRVPARAATGAVVSTGATLPAAAGNRRRPGRLPRRSAGDISQAVEQIVGLLSSNPAGLRAEQIRQKLGLQAKELPRPLKEGLEGGRLSKVGRKRATTYFAGAAAAKGRKLVATAARAARGRPAKAAAARKPVAARAKKAKKAGRGRSRASKA